jgi:TfoX/Sxy family transcriptional regulator of competence genes
MESFLSWEKPSKELVELFEIIVPELPGLEKRKMFGHPAAFVNNNMFMGVKGHKLVLRLSEKDLNEFLDLDGTEIFECTPGKFWKEYTVIPEWMYEDAQLLENWIERSFKFVSNLPPKQKKKKNK